MENIEELKNSTITGVIWRFGERILAQLINFIVSIVLARVLFPEEYGIVAIVTIFITIADSFVTNGLGTSLIQKKKADDKDFSTIFHASIILSFVLYVILFLLAPVIANLYSNNEIALILRIMGLRLPIAAINSIQQAYVSRKMIYKKFFYSTISGAIVSGIVGVIMALLGLGVWALVAQYLLNAIMGTIVLFIIIDWRPKLEFSFKKFKELFSFGWNVMMAGFIGTIFDQLKGFVIGLKYTATDLAYFNRGEQIPSLIYNNINVAFESVLFSAISKLQDNKESVKQALSKMIKIISFVMIPIMLGIVAISEPLVRLILTEKWIACVPFLQIICFQYCFSIINNINLQALKAIGRSDVLLKLEFIKKPLYIIFIIISMQISPLAIVIANLIYGLIALIINTAPNKKFLNYNLSEQIKDIIPAFLISLIMLGVCYPISLFKLPLILTLIIQVIVGVIIYVALSIIFKMEAFYFILNINFVKEILKKIKNVIKKIIVRFFSSKIFKIKKNKIVFDNFSGKGYGCNPKYIAEEIIRQKLDYDLVWLVSDMNQEFPKEIRKVKFRSIRALYELATAHIWIDNVRNFKGVNKKKNQFYIQTWHGGIGLKHVEKATEETLPEEYLVDAKNDGKITDLFITNNKFQEEYIRENFWYSGKILCCGTPRCDIIYKPNEEIKEKVYNYFNIDKNKKIIMYAPTFRKYDNFDAYKFDYKKCCKIFKQKYGKDFVMLIRLHPNISNKSNNFKYDNIIKNATNYPDVQELLAITEAVISDYSSVSFEVALVNKPAFLFSKDLKDYISNDRKIMFDIKDLPFEMSETEDELFDKILKFSQTEYAKKCEKFNKKLGVIHNEYSSTQIVQIIKERIEQ